MDTRYAATVIPMPTPQEEARFWMKVDRTIGGCWLWTGAKDAHGYGKARIAGQLRKAHRVAWMLGGRKLPTDRTIDHLCRNRACVNPFHLEAVTGTVNSARGGNAIKEFCHKGHAFTVANTYRYRGRRQCRACNLEAVKRYKSRVLA